MLQKNFDILANRLSS